MADIARKSLGNGVFFTAIAGSRFKNNLLSISFLLPLRAREAAVNALLPMVLKRGCREYPDMTALNRRLKELYGARLDGGVLKRGETHAVTLLCEFLSNDYALGGENILKECAGLMRSLLFTPALENGVFREEDVAIERRNLTDLIDSRLNEKRQYANHRLKEEMCKDEAYGVDELGTREQVAAVTPAQLAEALRRMTASAPAEILFLGSGDPSACEALFSEAFAGVRRQAAERPQTQVVRAADNVKNVVETLPVTQAKLVMGFRAGCALPESATAATQLMCTIFGGSPHSKLFANVREKLSLCYYCASRFERLKGLLLVDSGIEAENYEKARDEILRQFDLMKRGEFSDDEMKFALLSIRNSYLEISDSLDSLAEWYLGESVAGTLRSPDEAAEQIESVTREDVVAAAQKVTLDTVYLLRGPEKGGAA